MSSAWVALFLAGILEICWAIGLKYTEGFTRPWPSLFTIATFAGSMYLLARATSIIPIGTAYAIWVGIGAVGAAILGVILFHEPISPARILFLSLIVISLVGLKLTAG